jgi:hypothetical protein
VKEADVPVVSLPAILERHEYTNSRILSGLLT